VPVVLIFLLERDEPRVVGEVGFVRGVGGVNGERE
jgi:hypothetical protein